MTPISLPDPAKLHRALCVLLTPFDHGGTDPWRHAANAALRDLLDADMATFLLQLPGVERGYSAELGTALANVTPVWFEVLQKRYGVAREATRLGGAYSRSEVYHPHAAEIVRSEYYQEVVRPARAYDAIMLVSAQLDEGIRTGAYLFDRPALLFHHASPTGRRFGARGLSLLRIIQPAFEAGTQMVIRTQNLHRELATVIDVLPEPLLLLEESGEVLHANPAARSIALTPADAQAIRAVAADMTVSLIRERREGRHEPSTTSRIVDADAHRYHLRGSFAPASLVRDRVLVLVSIERGPSPAERSLQQQFRLTRQEARVAQLLAQRRSNAEIARMLCISEHTARHHTERVLAKLGGIRRQQVEAVLQR